MGPGARIVYNDDSLDQLVKNGDYEAANRLLKQMLADMKEPDDGRFGGNNGNKKTCRVRLRSGD